MRSKVPALRRKGNEAPEVELLAPRVGLWRDPPAVGSLIRPGQSLGAIEVLGVLYGLTAPAGATGIVVSGPDGGRARRPVAYGDLLLVLDPEGAVGAGAQAEATESSAVTGLAFVAPMSGRFYARPGPGKAPFVTPGQTIQEGDSVCLLEVMKTFNRLTYGGAGLPGQARVKRVIPDDGDDINGGDPILELEAD